MTSHQSLAMKNRKQSSQNAQFAELGKRKSSNSDNNNDKHRGLEAIKNMHKKFESYESTSCGSSSKKQNSNEKEEISIIGLKSGKISKKTKRKDEEEILFIGEKKKNKKNKKRRNVAEEKMSTVEEFDVLPQMATLTQDAKRSAQLAQQMFGPQRSKLKPGSLATNKNFLARTLHSVELDRQEWEERKAAAIKRGKRNMAKMDGKTNKK